MLIYLITRALPYSPANLLINITFELSGRSEAEVTT